MKFLQQWIQNGLKLYGLGLLILHNSPIQTLWQDGHLALQYSQSLSQSSSLLWLIGPFQKSNSTFIFDLKKKFIEHFEPAGFVWEPSKSVVPPETSDDLGPSTLCVNAGMLPYKSAFLNKKPPVAPRFISIQRCLRVGGRQNDLEHIGYSPWHLTLFEMMGCFGFDKQCPQLIPKLVWTFLTRTLGVPETRLVVTVGQQDSTNLDFWKQAGVKNHLIFPLRRTHTFWETGPAGPCGPCCEIHYLNTPFLSSDQILQELESGLPFSTNLVELCNVVTILYRKMQNGQFLKLNQPSVDCGIGLERLAAVLQSAPSTFEIESMRPLQNTAKRLFSQTLSTPETRHIESNDTSNLLSNILVDHTRAIVCMIIDGIHPDRKGRGYVLRRIIRRVLRLIYEKIELKVPAISLMLKENSAFDSIFEIFNLTDSELKSQQKKILSILSVEEALYFKLLRKGEAYIHRLAKQHRDQNLTSPISNECLTKLYSTYGIHPSIARNLFVAQKVCVDPSPIL